MFPRSASIVALLAGCVSEEAVITEPTIWITPSTTIDPTRLPLGDQHYAVDAPAHGYIYACDALMFRQSGGPGGSKLGEWIDPASHTYDMTKKVWIDGNVYFDDARLSITLAGDKRMIESNGLPVDVPTGVFPVASTDPAYAYDPNPNAIAAQTIAFSMPAIPVVAPSPSCIYKEVGLTLDGVPLHNPLDSIGREELAYELQDVCTGGAQPGGGYHRHALSECTPHIHDRVALVGYALDGFGIYSPYDADGRELTSADLDECHGLSSEVPWQGKQVTMYHYVMTRDYPYTIGCFKGTPTRNAFPALPGAPPQR